MAKIFFYREREAYGFLSNFSPHPVEIGGKTWPTTEHYFQAQKFAGTDHEETIRQARTPKEAKDLGQDRSRPIRADWESVKDDVMRTALHAKFTQHTELYHRLLDTGTAKLVEKTTLDTYWGCGSDGRGKNMLGKLLMQLRDELREMR